MRKILLAIIALGCGMNIANAQSANNQATIQDSHHAIIAYVKPTGTIYNNDNAPVWRMMSNGTITDGKDKTIGFVTMQGEIQDANHKTIGYLKGASFEDNNHRAIGSVKDDGTLVAADNSVAGYETNTEAMWAGLYVFMFKK